MVARTEDVAHRVQDFLGSQHTRRGDRRIQQPQDGALRQRPRPVGELVEPFRCLQPPTSAPIDEPAIPTIWYPRSCSSWITPIWAYPRAPPLPSASATRGCDESVGGLGIRIGHAFIFARRGRVLSAVIRIAISAGSALAALVVGGRWAATITAAWRANGSAAHGVFQVPALLTPGAWTAAK